MNPGPRDIGLYLELTAAEGAAERLRAVLTVTSVQSVLIRPMSGARLDASNARPLIEVAQAAGAAALLEHDARLALSLRADGVHLPWNEDIAGAYEEARGILGSSCIIGASAGALRHDAMSLGEMGADYVAFDGSGGTSDRASVVGQLRAQIEWWAEIFEVPCVALGIADPSEVGELVRSGSDFLGIPIPAGEPPDASAGRIRAMLQAIAAVEETVAAEAVRGTR